MLILAKLINLTARASPRQVEWLDGFHADPTGEPRNRDRGVHVSLGQDASQLRSARCRRHGLPDFATFPNADTQRFSRHAFEGLNS